MYLRLPSFNAWWRTDLGKSWISRVLAGRSSSCAESTMEISWSRLAGANNDFSRNWAHHYYLWTTYFTKMHCWGKFRLQALISVRYLAMSKAVLIAKKVQQWRYYWKTMHSLKEWFLCNRSKKKRRFSVVSFVWRRSGRLIPRYEWCGSFRTTQRNVEPS